ncbi:MAG: hypothetical protein K1X66_01655 [Verrucomicrobiae bacterium]|nr:hypothetical protein [Verrucomicrobiae bacterium]
MENKLFSKLLFCFLLGGFLIFAGFPDAKACSKMIKYFYPDVKVEMTGTCEIDPLWGTFKVVGTQYTLTFGNVFVFMANKDEEACPDEFDQTGQIKLCIP